MNIELREIKKVLPKKNTIKIIETVYSSTYTFLLHVLQYIVMQLNVAASKWVIIYSVKWYNIIVMDLCFSKAVANY